MTYEQALISAKNGNAVIFYGAGFCRGLTSALGKELPTGKGLAEILCQEIDMDNVDDLKDAAQYYLREKSPEDLIRILKDHFTVYNVDDFYNQITQIDWRSIYTTNYDNSFETSALKNGIRYESVDIEAIPRNTAGKKRIIHINGYIDTISPEKLNTSFKLTNKSYLTEHFRQSAWSEVFKRDIESAHAIFFVGYSLYDLDIKEILHANIELKSKTFFIEREDMTQREIDRSFTTDFGLIKNIGIKQFSIDLSNVDQLALNNNQELIVTSFDKLIFQNSDEDIQDKDVHDLLISGKLVNDNLYNDYLTKKEKYLILRDDLSIAIERLKAKENIIIHSGLANGKTILSKQVAANFQNNGYQIYELNDNYLNTYAFREIENILAKSPCTLFIVENYTENLDIVKHVNDNRLPETKLLLTSRSHEHYRCENDVFYSQKILEIKNTADLIIDKLSDNDIDKIFNFLHLYGLWGEIDLHTDGARKHYLSSKASAEFHGILLGLLKSPQVIKRFDGFYEEMMQSSVLMTHIVAVLCLSITNIIKPTFHMISGLTNSSAIFEPALRKNKVFQQILHSEDSTLVAKSSVLAEFILTRFPNFPLLVNCLVQIAKNAREKANGNHVYFKFYKDIANSRYIQKILPERGKREALILFYQGLKEIPQERENPHFWLHYAIARLSFPDKDNLENAERHLNHALKLAHSKKGYWTDDIETQYARFYLENAIFSFNKESIELAMKNFDNGINKIFLVYRNNRYRKELYRPVKLILPFYDKYYRFLSKSNLENIINKCNDLNKIFNKDSSKFERDIQFRRARENVNKVLSSAKLQLHIIEN